MNSASYQELSAHIDTLEHAVELISRQLALMRNRLESVAEHDAAVPQQHLPLPPETDHPPNPEGAKS